MMVNSSPSFRLMPLMRANAYNMYGAVLPDSALCLKVCDRGVKVCDRGVGCVSCWVCLLRVACVSNVCQIQCGSY